MGDITVTVKRKEFVDFSEPFMETNLSILIRKEFADNITSFKDLSEQTFIRYGIMKCCSTRQYFAQSNDSTIQKMYQYLEANPDNYVLGNKHGIEKVLHSTVGLTICLHWEDFIHKIYCRKEL